MGRRPASDVLVPTKVGDAVIMLATSTLTTLPDAVAFVSHLREQNHVVATAIRYANAVANAKRIGVWMTPEIIASQLTRTAVNSYWRWIEGHYETRVAPVLRALVDSALRDGVGRLRISSLVGPFAGKTIPVKGAPHAQENPDGSIAWHLPPRVDVRWLPCERWTLHVPLAGAPVHKDPCIDCAVIELTPAQLKIVADAYYKAWGPRDPSTLPPECLLFGQPPPTSVYAPAPPTTPVGRVVALLPDGPVCEAIERLRGTVASQVNAFIDRVSSNPPDVIVISRAVAGDRLRDVVGAVIDAWGGIAPAAEAEPASAEPEQHENVVPIRPAAADEA